ncbi:hypothetical protein Glove_23g193 [Diversispora epigaea]|uniref:Uncharacterized protein n=1 Tax=Diversispora epigaea TaxID=1348612 RepID=A0A397JU09_9GLOM|nr:hypothetical protein Glove_23g193 [Diversispora epigaea]
MSNLNELFKKKKQNPLCTSSYSRASSAHPSSASASRPSSASALRPSSASALHPSVASASRPSLFPRPLLESEDSDLTSSSAVIIKSAQDLLEKKIYPNYDEFKESAEFFLRESDNEFFSTLGSTLCARIKTAIFKNFNNMLPPISNVAKASEIVAWKKKLAVSNCFRKLFEKIEDDENDTYMTKIIKNVWPKKKNIPNLQIAWANSISEIFLNPKNEVIKMSEEIIQPALARNLRKIENEEGFEYESDSSPTSQRPERKEGKKRIIEVETLQKNLKKSKRKVENNEYEGKKNNEYEGDEVEEGEEGDEGEDDDDEDDEDDEDEEGEDEEYHNEIVNIESED